MGDWTPEERRIRAQHGTIFYGGPCRDDYPNMEAHEHVAGQLLIVLQGPALEALKAAEVRYGVATNRPIGRRDIIITPGSNRSCATQARLFAQDPNRFADPKITGHTRGLAIDVSTSQPNQSLIRECLLAEGWSQTRPDDEPWHFSYGVTI